MTQQKQKHGSLADARIEKYYNKIVAGFIVLTLLLILIIIYFTFAKTTIVIHAKAQTQEETVATSVSELQGTILLTEIEGEKEVTLDDASSESTPAKATGTVTLINEYSGSQGLVATTRLLSEDGILFRTTQTVTVPAGGSIEVGVIADQEGAQGNIDPSRFEIVALSSELKEFIYAESDTRMTGGVITNTTVSQTDVANAQQELESELAKEAVDLFAQEMEKRDDLPENPLLLEDAAVVETIESTSSAQAGDKTDSFTVSQKITMAGIVVNRDTLNTLLTTKLQEAIGAPVSDVGVPSAVDITDMSDDKQDAQLNITVQAQTTLAENSDMIDTNEITGKSESEVRSYIETIEGVDSVEVQFSPFWLKRTPSIANNIQITIE